MTPSKSALLRITLPLTIRHAAKNKFYERHWKSAGIGLSDLPQGDDAYLEFHDRLPPIHKDHLRGDLQPDLIDGDRLSAIINTSGTTGRPIYRFRSIRERELTVALSPPTVTEVRKLGLSLYAPFHGVDRQTNVADAYVFAGSVLDDYLLRLSIDRICENFHVAGLPSRVSFLQGSVRYVRVFTQALVDLGIGVESLAVRGLTLYAGFLATEVRQTLREYWRVPIINHYSSSEVEGGAVVCERCGHLQFYSPVHVTLSKPRRMTSLDDGELVIGDLCFTELYPHGYAQPLVKYCNGDIGELLTESSACCAEHVGGIRHLGRRQDSVFAEDGTLILGASALKDSLYCPLVRKSFEFPHLTVVQDRSLLGHPLASIAFDPTSERLTVSCNPAGYGGEGAAEVEERLLGRSSHLRAATRERGVKIVVLFDPRERNELNK